MHTYPCIQCGTIFLRPRPDANGMKWCSLACRLWYKIDKSGGPDACWNFAARSRTAHGYGVLNVDGKLIGAHRIAYELANGQIANDPATGRTLFVCHRCDNPACCNPAHLFIGTPQDNSRDMHAKGRNAMSPEGKERLRASKLGKPRPPEVREKLRLANLGKVPPNKGKPSPMRGIPRPEHSEKMRAAWARKKAALV